MKERFIFDLDGTLMNGDFSMENDYFKSVLSSDVIDYFLEVKLPLLHEYENFYSQYNIFSLSEFLTKRSGVNITYRMIEELNLINSQMNNVLVEGIVSLLEHLKSQDKSLVVLSNGLTFTQVERLKKEGLFQYFDEVIGGDYCFKPLKESYIKAMGEYDISQCVMIGDTFEKDVLGPRKLGMDAIHYNENANNNDDKFTIKQMKKIKEMY